MWVSEELRLVVADLVKASWEPTCGGCKALPAALLLASCQAGLPTTLGGLDARQALLRTGSGDGRVNARLSGQQFRRNGTSISSTRQRHSRSRA